MLKSKMNQLFAEQKSVHILYSYDQQENYIQQVVSYIQEGIFAGDFILLIEMEGDLITSEPYLPLTDLK
ncbi:hypothetical protein ABEY43_09860 [Priestia megaterium]|uniref:hypothetical protein n=1 Tax=Priestia megaterium TaxID=1404 RepID=UPI002E214FEE|nr:hypothetical protein [Priestia megaterium]